MPVFSTMTLAELRSKTAAQIATALKNKIDTLSKRQLINLVLAIRDHDTASESQMADEAATSYHPDGQIRDRTEVVRDVLGAKVKSRKVEWSYHPDGSVADIVLIELNATDKEVSRKTISHFTDGRQPILTVELAE